MPSQTLTNVGAPTAYHNYNSPHSYRLTTHTAEPDGKAHYDSVGFPSNKTHTSPRYTPACGSSKTAVYHSITLTPSTVTAIAAQHKLATEHHDRRDIHDTKTKRRAGKTQSTNGEATPPPKSPKKTRVAPEAHHRKQQREKAGSGL